MEVCILHSNSSQVINFITVRFLVTGTVLPCTFQPSTILSRVDFLNLQDFMKEFHTTYMMSSLLYAGSTVGSVKCIFYMDMQLTHTRFMTGTLLVEHIVNRLGQINAARDSWSWFPYIAFVDKYMRRRRGSPPKCIGFSPSQAQFISLLVASTLHAMFFVIMGNGRGFWMLFCAYIVAAFARSILTGQTTALLLILYNPGLTLSYSQHVNILSLFCQTESEYRAGMITTPESLPPQLDMRSDYGVRFDSPHAE